MKSIFAVVLLTLSTTANSQYYYKDITGTMESNRLLQTYRQQKVLSVSAIGIKPDGTQTDEFKEDQLFSAAANQLKIITVPEPSVSNTFYYLFDAGGNVTATVDSSEYTVSKRYFIYNVKKLLTRIKFEVSSPDTNINEREEHVWIYNTNDKPVKMFRIKNGADTVTYTFSLDENGNVIDEKPVINGVEGESVLYYYDDLNRLTDVVRYNKKAQMLLPDYMFEYDEKNNVIQKITTVSGKQTGYIIWRYLYNAAGLKTKEATYNRDKELTGKIEYKYIFSK
jgi:hypothetical protein